MTSTAIATLLCPVIMTAGNGEPIFFNRLSKSNPIIPGRFTSINKHAFASPWRYDAVARGAL
jgi:hypothetical protein